MALAAASGESESFLVCHINLDRGFRGGERQTELLIRQLAQAGWSQRVVLRHGAALARRLSDVRGLEIRFCSGLLSAAISIGKPDLVHVHQGRAIYPAYLRKLLSGVPYIVTRRVQSRPTAGWFTRRAYAGASKLVAISRSVAQSMSEAMSLPQEQMALIPSAFESLPTDPAAAQALRLEWGGQFIVGNVAALDGDHKGQRDLIAVAREFSVSHPQIHFVFVGSGRDEESFRLESQDLGNIHFAGFQDRVGDYLGAFDLFAFPSMKEGMGSVLLDAMDHGLAVVASDVGGIPEVVVDGQTGLLVPAASPDQLGAAILKFYADPDLRQAMGRAGKQRSDLFRASIMAQRYVTLYRGLLG